MIKTKTAMLVAIALLLAGLAVGWIVNGWRLSGEINQLEADHASHVATQQAASADVISRTLLRERQLQLDLSEARANATTREETLTDELADSDAAARRMRDQLHHLSGRIGSDTGTVAECKAARAAARVLAGLLESFDRAAGVYAESSVRNRSAGLNCEAEHDAAARQSKEG